MLTVSMVIILAAVMVVVRGGVVAPVAPVAVAARIADSEYDPNPQYSFAYDVQDALTGDSKSQVESRSGDIVQGQYSVVDPDGTRRTVDYVADPINGFNAVVRKSPLVAVAPVVAKAAPVVAAPAAVAPVLARAAPVVAAPAVAAPLAAAAPIAAAPAFARFSSPYFAPAPAFARLATPVASPFVAAPAPVAYAASPFSYPAGLTLASL